MKRLFLMALALGVLLAGCGLLDGSYSHVTPHKDNSSPVVDQNVSVSDYEALCEALSGMVEAGTQSGVIWVSEYPQNKLHNDIGTAVSYVEKRNPIAAYAVEKIQCELGTNAGKSAIAVNITYTHDKAEILKIRRVTNIELGKSVIAERLEACADSVVLHIQNYGAVDFVQFVEDYADDHPDRVMETPQVKVNIYPDSGNIRVVELKFTYENSREWLRSIQKQVSPVFEAAKLYVSGDSTEEEKFSQLYSFLMERHTYTVQSSITPAYSLIRHGEGDSKAFANVYAAMCRQSGLECRVITGTHKGEAWYWNLIRVEDVWYHVDLLRCSRDGSFLLRFDEDMNGYVWDYSGYPASRLPDVTEPTETTAPEM